MVPSVRYRYIQRGRGKPIDGVPDVAFHRVNDSCADAQRD
jgi:hypothetical protein